MLQESKIIRLRHHYVQSALASLNDSAFLIMYVSLCQEAVAKDTRSPERGE